PGPASSLRFPCHAASGGAVMNDLMPPDRRPMPADRSRTMRTFLQAEAARDRPSRRRTWAPLAVTVTVAAIAFGGYVTATQLDDGRGGAGLQSAGPSGDSDPEPTSHPEPTLDDRPEGDPARNLLTDGAGPSDAGERCLDAIRREYRRGGDTPPDLSDFETRVVAE